MRVWDDAGVESSWSSPAAFRAGLQNDDWRGPWIGAVDDDLLATANQNYRTTVTVPGSCVDAIVYIASLGYHELHINGKRVGDDVLSPAISDPLHRVRYVAYDVSDHVRPGINSVCVAVGAGWTLYDGHGWSDAAAKRWPRRPALRVQGLFHDANGGHVGEFHADKSWRTHPAEIQPLRRWQFRDFNGERLVELPALEGWTAVDYDDASWPMSVVRAAPEGLRLTPQEVESNRVLRVECARSVDQIAEGVFRATFSKMFTGFVQIDLTGPPRGRVQVETSDRVEQPLVYGQQSEAALDERGHASFGNRFNYVNGQWLTIRGDISRPEPQDIRALHIGTDLRRIGRFRCSDELHNRIYETALDTYQCLNLGGYVVDCAHRERLGYGGDGQSTAMLALANYECTAFYEKWLRDWCDMLQPDGNLTFTAPTYGGGGGPAWSGFVVHVATDLFSRQGDPTVCRMVLPVVRKWLSFLRAQTTNDLLVRYDGPSDFVQHEWSFLGDWVYPGHDQTPNNDAESTLFLNNCYYAWTLRRAAVLAAAANAPDDAKQWRDQADATCRAIHAKYWQPERSAYAFDSQACLAIAILAEIAPPALREQVEQRFVAAVEHDRGGHVDTGIGGTVFLLRALQQLNRPDLGALIAGQRDYPGWGHMLEQGATAFWEQWDGVNSRCHSSYLAIGGWYVESIAGIQVRSADQGFERFEIRPGVVPGMTWAEGEWDSSRGMVKSSWRLTDGGAEFDVVVPPNTRAEFYVPVMFSGNPTVNDASPEDAPGVLSVRRALTPSVLELDSGQYRIHVSR